jgi:hypothetical protein
MLDSVQGTDVLAGAIVIGGAVAFALGSIALAHAQDISATYWIVVGFVALRAGYAVVEGRDK